MISTPLRPRHDISDGWEFTRGRVSRRWLQGRKRGGEAVDLPHCWNRSDTFQHGERSYSGYGAYRRALVLPEPADEQGCWRMHAEGFFGLGDIWLDGRCLTRFDGQYLGFALDLPSKVDARRHVLALRLNNVFRRDVLPGRRDPDFLLYGGLAGRMWLEWVPAIHIHTDSVEVVSTPEADGSESLELRCSVNGPDESLSSGGVKWTVSTSDGALIASTSNGAATIPAPRCWSPQDPHLYWAEGTLENADGATDVVRVRFGITRAEFRPNHGFFLDGRRVDLHGCNRHESIPGLGNALPEELHRADAQLLNHYGCNFVRLSHYPQHPAFLDACDELGIMVYAEIASWKTVSSSRGWRRAARRQMRSMILRDRHHPSVILWGMGNESRSRKAYLELRKIARKLDPSRPVTYAENHLYRAKREKTVGIPDVWSVNYELEVLEEARDACRLKNVIASECCNFPNSVKGDDGAELTQVATLEYEWKLMEDRPFLAGHTVWSFTDYATEHRKRYPPAAWALRRVETAQDGGGTFSSAVFRRGLRLAFPHRRPRREKAALVHELRPGPIHLRRVVTDRARREAPSRVRPGRKIHRAHRRGRSGWGHRGRKASGLAEGGDGGNQPSTRSRRGRAELSPSISQCSTRMEHPFGTGTDTFG